MKSLNPLTPFVIAMEKIFPGYHFLRYQQMTNTNLPLFRRTIRFDFFEHGWELHSLLVLIDMEIIFEPELELAIYQHYILRVCQAIVDVNIHNGQWNAQEAIEFVGRAAGVPHHYATHAVREVIRFPAKFIAAVVGCYFISQYKDHIKQGNSIFEEKSFIAFFFNNHKLPWKFLINSLLFYMSFKPNHE